MTGFIVSVFLFRNRVSSKEAFEGLELGEGKLSRPVLRGPGGRKAAWLLGSNRRRQIKELPPMLVYHGRNLSKVEAVAKEIMSAGCRLCLSKTSKCLSGWELYFLF